MNRNCDNQIAMCMCVSDITISSWSWYADSSRTQLQQRKQGQGRHRNIRVFLTSQTVKRHQHNDAPRPSGSVLCSYCCSGTLLQGRMQPPLTGAHKNNVSKINK